MRIIDPGHVYYLRVLDGEPHEESILAFVKRKGAKYPGNNSTHSGTTNQEVLRAVVDRLGYVDYQIPHERNRHAWEYIKSAIWELEARAAERHGRPIPDIQEAVYGILCPKCNHAGCEGTCH